MVHVALCRDAPLIVVPLSPLTPPPDHRIDDHVPRSRVKGIDGIEASIANENGDVADTTDILHRDAFAGLGEEEVVDKGGQRSPLAANGHVGAAEITDDR